MPLLFFSLIGIPLCASPWIQHQLFEKVFRRERATVAVDNGAILLGRAVREEGRRWDRFRREMEIGEAVHHVAHACARLPGATAACQAEDLALERELAARLDGFRVQVELSWARAGALPSVEGFRLGERVRAVGLPVASPGRWTVCPLCGLRTPGLWEPPRSVTVQGEDGTSAEVVVALYWGRQGRAWQYHLEVSEHEPSGLGPF